MVQKLYIKGIVLNIVLGLGLWVLEEGVFGLKKKLYI
jgi:hypothetical protein